MSTLVKTISILFISFFLTNESFASAEHHDKSNANWRTGLNVSVAEDEILPEELSIAGIHVDIQGIAEKELNVIGIKVLTAGDFQKEVIIAAADAELGGIFQEQLTCYAANAELSGTFNSNVVLKAARITLDPNTVINGNLEYSAASIEGLEQATIIGTASEIPLDESEEEWEGWNEKTGEFTAAAAVAAWFISLGAILVTGLVINALFPHHVENVVGTISGSPWAGIGVGFVVLVAAPPAIVICLATLVGIPLGLIAGMLYLTALFISQIFSGLWLGRTITGRFRGGEPPQAFFWPFALGIFLIWLVGLIPFIGWLAGFIFTLLGLGALWLTVYRSIQANRA